MSPARPPLSAQDILAALNRRGVRYSKEEAGRAKDIRVLPALRRFIRDRKTDT